LNKVLFVAFHFPPCGVGSGVHRASRFAAYLEEYGWRPYVLTVNDRAHERTDNSSGHLNRPNPFTVLRAFALDAQRHLAVRGRYLFIAAVPDRWANWVLSAVPAGLIGLYREKVDLILVTFPIATAVLVALILHRLTGKPLVVDFRDSMTEKGYPPDPRTRAIHQWIERQVIKHGSRFIFTARSARQMYLDRYPELAHSSCIVIPNGYDEDDFADIEGRSRTDALEGCIRLVHAGVIYPDDRDPKSFFRAVHKMRRDGVIDARVLKIDLRASGAERYYASLLRELEIDDIVHLLPALPHRESLKDTAASDGLLLFQAASCNHQIPAKVYEYFRLNKPILALTATAGDTAMLLNEVGGATIVDLKDEEAIVRQLAAFLDAVRHGTHSLPDPNRVSVYTRKNATAALARCLDQLMELRTVQNSALNEPVA